MGGARLRGEEIRRFILDNVEAYPGVISKITEEKFGITRQAVNKHLKKLSAESLLTENGQTRSRVYKLAETSVWEHVYRIKEGMAEDLIWKNGIKEVLGNLPNNVLDIWHYGFTEMFNNAIDHSEGTKILVKIKKTAVNTSMMISDDGVGIFKKIQVKLNLLDERHAIFELSKGKLTTDPRRHSGEGVFFTSRVFDSYDIISGGVIFSHQLESSEDWLAKSRGFNHGTFVWMKLNNHTNRTTKAVFDAYAPGEDYQFNKTVVPVRLAQYGNDKLISRSQAKRLLARVELFKVVLFDFEGVDAIGQAFADEIFRVFVLAHPHMELHVTHANAEVKQMIERAKKVNL